MRTTTIREATAADVEVLAEIQQRSSVEALGHIYPRDRYPFPIDAVRERWRTFAGRLLLAEVEGRAVGMVGIEPPWLEGLYVIPPAWGTGVAGELHERALDLLRGSGTETARLWVLEQNIRARRFYERRGWRPDGNTRVVPFPPHPLDVGYSIPLGSGTE